MTTMVERVTEALAKIAGKVDGCYSDRCCCHGVEAFECKTGVDLEDLARAAIEAMREPTKGMLKASERQWYDGPDETWPLMIDAALAEGGEG